MSGTVEPVPARLHTITTRLVFARQAAEAIEFYGKAFDVEPIADSFVDPDGKVIHAEVRIGDSVVFVTDEGEENGSAPSSVGGKVTAVMALNVPDVDEVWNRAIAAGCEVIYPLDNHFYGDRGGRVRDPFGHQWMISTHIEDVDADEMQRRMQQYMGEQADRVSRRAARPSAAPTPAADRDNRRASRDVDRGKERRCPVAQRSSPRGLEDGSERLHDDRRAVLAPRQIAGDLSPRAHAGVVQHPLDQHRDRVVSNAALRLAVRAGERVDAESRTLASGSTVAARRARSTSASRVASVEDRRRGGPQSPVSEVSAASIGSRPQELCPSCSTTSLRSRLSSVASRVISVEIAVRLRVDVRTRRPLRSRAFSVETMGLEPTTPCLQSRCSSS